jgi:hypothetical protein
VSGADAAALDDTGPQLDDLVDDTVDLWFDRVSLGPDPPPEVDEFAEEAVDPVSTTTTAPATGSQPASPAKPAEVAPSVRAEAFRHSFDAAKGPALYFLHLMLPHRPWVHQADGEEYDPHDRHLGDMPLGDQPVSLSWAPWVAAVSEQRHLLQAQYADALVGQMLDTLRDEGLYDDSLIVVTADHGIAFGERTNSRYVEPPTVDGIAYSPLLVKEPGQDEGVVDDTNMTSIDVLPTIADRLGLTPDWDVDGLPAGSAGIRARGDEKHIYDIAGASDLVLRGILDFSDAEDFPRADDRWIGPIDADDDVLAGLTRLLGLDDVLGRDLDDLRTGDGGTVQIDALDELRRLPTDRPPTGVVTGRASRAPAGSQLVLAVNGVVVGGSELEIDSDGVDGLFRVLLPQGVLRAENDIRAALVTADGIQELQVDG